MDAVHEIILVFTKYPQPGRSKTRLIPALGAEGAARLQWRMTRLIVEKAIRFTAERSIALKLYHEGGSAAEMRQWLGEDLVFCPQAAGDLGRRMQAAMEEHLRRDMSVVLVGSDCPGIDTDILSRAFATLKRCDMVFGPAYDGGYYLIGAAGRRTSEDMAPLFAGIAWGSAQVLAQTLVKAQRQGLSYELLPKRHDIDTADDLRHLHHHPHP